LGWEPTVVALDTGQFAAQQVVRLPSATPWHRPYEMTPYGWAHALGGWLKQQSSDRWDLVYVSCPPYPQALTASAYGVASGVPVVVDFRDAWSLDPYQEGSRLKRLLYRHLFPRLERRLVSRTSMLILNTPSALAAYRQHYPAHAQRMVYLPNGFDEDAFGHAKCPPPREDQTMHLLYAGRFGIGGRSPERLLAALAVANANGCRLCLEVVGQQPAALLGCFSDGERDGSVRLVDEVDYPKAVAMMCQADALVLIQAPSKGRVQAVAGKTYDYLRSGRPILAVAPEGDNVTLIREHASTYALADDTVAGITAALKDLYARWQSGALTDAMPDPAFVSRFDRRLLSAELAAHFDRLLDAGGA
jgi:glycosyltransferase involved in cell wall biosynthesis